MNTLSFRIIWGIPLGGKCTLTQFSNSEKTPRLKIMIFEKGSPKGIFRQNMNNVPKWSLSQDSQCYQGGALKYVLGDYVNLVVMRIF